MKALALLAAILLIPGPAFANIPDRFWSLLESRDIVFSEAAALAPAITLINEPAKHSAGVSVDAEVAGYYEHGNSLNNPNSHHQGKEDNNDKGNKTGHVHAGSDDGSVVTPPPAIHNGEFILNNEFTNGLEHWTSRNAFVTSSFGPIKASALSTDGVFAVAHTGYGWNSNHGYIEQAINVPMSRNGTFKMLFNFVTTEFPYWQGSQYNDYFQVTLEGPSGKKTFSAAEFLNSTSFSLVTGLPNDVLEGWGWANGGWVGGQTGWQNKSSGSLALKSGIYRLRISVHDVGDSIVDSAILIDRVSLR